MSRKSSAADRLGAALVHFSDLSTSVPLQSNQVTPLESQTIHMSQYVFGRTLRDPAAVRLAPRFVNVKSCTAEVGEPRHAQGRFGCRVNRPLQPYLSFLNRWMGSLVLCFWHRLDQQRERLAEACGAGRFASIVPETHDDEIVRGNHQRRLPAGARHVIGIARDWISPVAVEPKESSIDRPIVRGPGGRKRADEFGIALWENALTMVRMPSLSNSTR